MKPAIAIALILSASVAYAGWRDLPATGNIEDRRNERGFVLVSASRPPVSVGLVPPPGGWSSLARPPVQRGPK
jgi:hypothetical protein